MNWVTWAGIGIAALGWLMMFLGVGVRTGFGDVANLHSMAVASGLINTGIGVTILGALLNMGELLAKEKYKSESIAQTKIDRTFSVRDVRNEDAPSKADTRPVADLIVDENILEEVTNRDNDGTIHGRGGSFHPYWIIGDKFYVSIGGDMESIVEFQSLRSAERYFSL